MYGWFDFSFVGTCVADPEYSHLTNGQPRCVIAVAVNEPEKNKEGTYEERTTFVRVAFFGDAANRKSLEWCIKGSSVACKGKVRSFLKETPNGNFTMYNFRPDTIRPLGTPMRRQSSSGDSESGPGEDPMAGEDDGMPDAFS